MNYSMEAGLSSLKLILEIEPAEKCQLRDWLLKMAPNLERASQVMSFWKREILVFIENLKGRQPVSLNQVEERMGLNGGNGIHLDGLPFEVDNISSSCGRKQVLFPVGFKQEIEEGLMANNLGYFRAVHYCLTGDDANNFPDLIIAMFYHLAANWDHYKNQDSEQIFKRSEGGRLEIRYEGSGVANVSSVISDMLGIEIVLISRRQVEEEDSSGSAFDRYLPYGSTNEKRIYLLKTGHNTYNPLVEGSPIPLTGTTHFIHGQNVTFQLGSTSDAPSLPMTILNSSSILLEDLSSHPDLCKILLRKLKTIVNSTLEDIRATTSLKVTYDAVKQSMDMRKTLKLGGTTVLVAKCLDESRNLADCYSQCIKGDSSLKNEIHFNLEGYSWSQPNRSGFEARTRLCPNELPFSDHMADLMALCQLFSRPIRIYYSAAEDDADAIVKSLKMLYFFTTQNGEDRYYSSKPVTLFYDAGGFSPVLPLPPFEEAVCAHIPDMTFPFRYHDKLPIPCPRPHSSDCSNSDSECPSSEASGGAGGSTSPDERASRSPRSVRDDLVRIYGKLMPATATTNTTKLVKASKAQPIRRINKRATRKES